MRTVNVHEAKTQFFRLIDAAHAGETILVAAALLLDTHALHWWLVEPKKLSTHAQEAINDPAATVFVSAATGWEFATKVRLGKRTCSGGGCSIEPNWEHYL